MRPVPQVAVDFIKQHEGLRLTAYQDSGGVWTIGYGHTGPSVGKGLTITQATADAYLSQDLSAAGLKLARRVKDPIIQGMTDNQYAALLSFVFNVGADPGLTIWKRLNAKRYDLVPAELRRFVNAGGVKVQGLVNRRAAEEILWSTAEPGSVPDTPSSAVTRVEPTPPTPAPTQTGHLITAGLAACSAVPVAAQKVHDVLSPYADASPYVAQGLTILATVSAGAALTALALTWLHARQAKR